MASSTLLLAFPLILMHILAPTIAQQPTFLDSICSNDNGNYTADSTYSTNLNRLRSSVSTTTEFKGGFYNISEGESSDKVNAIALCRGDVSKDVCLNCLNASSFELPRRCPNQKEGIVWYDECLFRYSNRSIYGEMEVNPFFRMPNSVNVTNMNEFYQSLRTLLDDITNRAKQGGDLRKFAVGDTPAPDFETIFGLAQCTPDLTEQACDDCLGGALRDFANCCSGREGGRVVRPSCNIRFEIYPFYESTAETLSPPTSIQSPPPSVQSPPQTTLPDGGKESKTSRTIIVVVIPIISVLVLMLCICSCIYLRQRKRKPKKIDESAVNEISVVESLQFDFNTIKTATDNFSNKIGQGGFGAVYKGRLYNGQEIAVKRLAMGSGQGNIEFKNEFLLVAKLQHRNLVRLLGFCSEGDERILIYEFVANTSLDNFIFDPVKRAQLDWESRSKIIGGITRGLLYLHEDSRLRIIHRDLKASNILLDADMNPKIADFGMARLFEQMDETQIYTNRIVGTYGYMAPEYALNGRFSAKLDVYSFGVLVLEIVSGQRNNCFSNGEITENLLSYAWRHWKEGTASNFVDSTLMNGSGNEMMRCIHVALLCVQENVADRPTMASVVLMLGSYSTNLQMPSQPAFLFQSSNASNVSSSLSRSSQVTAGLTQQDAETLPLSRNEASITESYPR
ncbi:putative receptor-like protein kinase At4g00960 [Tripterygium wilfordii]|uniref:putative receptor-like protein kinase At4g00960 n=1 Tax=Tripterygium wilfordii TaxID=458696 RepID=UPI0018F8631B|nr:putative receptor-like protein kinase At4g00960 [Tripterygium wilfordii]